MNLSELQKFCDPSRDTLALPFSGEQFTYATNGHIVIRISRLTEVEPSEFAPKVTKLFAENPRDGLTAVELPADIPALEIGTCPDCGGAGKIVHLETEMVCDECDGSGHFERPERVAVGDSGFANKYLLWLKELPDVKFYPSGIKPAPFTFDGGDGLLMPRTQ